MNKKILGTAVLVVAAFAVVPFVIDGDGGWGSACACVPLNVSFSTYSATKRSRLFDPEEGPPSVTKGLLARFGGQTVGEAEEFLGSVFKRMRCQAGTDSRVCEIWLERKSGEERGYEVSFALSADSKVQGVKARIIQFKGTRL